MTRTFQKTKENSQLTAWLLLLFLAAVWGMSFILIKKVTPVYTAIEIGAGRVFVASVTLLPWALASRKRYPRSKTGYFTLSGLFGFFLPALIFAYLGSRINSSLSGMLNSTTPIFTLLIGTFFFGHIIKKQQLFGILFGFIGSLILVFTGAKGGIDFNNPLALLAFAATIMYGLNVNIVGTYLKGIKAVELTSYTLLVVGGISLILLLFFTKFFQKTVDLNNIREVLYLVILGGFNSAFAVVIFNYLVQLTSPLFGSSVTYLIPIVAIIAGSLDGEVITVWHFAGMGIILLGIYLINKK